MIEFIRDVFDYGLRVAWWNLRFNVGFRIGGFHYAERLDGCDQEV